MKKELRKIAGITAFLVGTLFSFSWSENSVKTDIYLNIINSFSGNFQLATGGNNTFKNGIFYTNTNQIQATISSDSNNTYILTGDISLGTISGSEATAYATTIPLTLTPGDGTKYLHLQFIKGGEVLVYNPIIISIDSIAPEKTILSYPTTTTITNGPTIFSWSGSIDSGAGIKDYTIIIATDNLFTNSVEIKTSPNNEAYIDTNNFPTGKLYWRILAQDETNNISSSDISYFCNKTTCDTTAQTPTQPTKGSAGGGGFFGSNNQENSKPETQWITMIEAIETQVKKDYPEEPAEVNIFAKIFYDQEQITAYEYAYSLGITTMPTIYKANLNGNLLRRDMAKMISEYAIKVIGKKPNNSIDCSFTDISDDLLETKYYTKLACKLGLMGWEADGIVKSDKFNPDNEVTRAQFATVFSRLLYGNTYNLSSGENIQRYQKHLIALNENNIIKKVDTPEMKELRGWVMLMMMRGDRKTETTHAASH